MLGITRELPLTQTDTFNTDRLVLRPCGADDLGDLHHLWSQPDIRRFLFDDRTISREEALSFIEASLSAFANHGYGIWLFFEAGSNEIAGFAGLLESSQGAPNLIYGTRPGLWGRGYATEAARGVLWQAFEVRRLERVMADVDEPNEKSVQVLERIGMRQMKRGIVNKRPLLYYEMDVHEWESTKRHDSRGESRGATDQGYAPERASEPQIHSALPSRPVNAKR